VVALSQDHKLTNEEEKGRMLRSGVVVGKGQTRIGGGIAITRALGDHFAKDSDSGMIAVPYISEPIELTPDHTHLIVASDGVFLLSALLKKNSHADHLLLVSLVMGCNYREESS